MAIDKVKIMERRTASSTNLNGAGIYYSDQPFETSAFSSEIIDGYALLMGNADNYLIITVMWGLANEGQFPYEHATAASSTIKWEADNTLVKYVYADATPANQVNFRLVVPQIKGMFRKLQVELGGTTPTADIEIFSLPTLL